MAEKHIAQINIKQILRQKAPKISGKIPGFIINYLIRTVHQDELNDILRRYHDKQGADFMNELISYFDLTLELVNENDFSKEGRYIFASNHPLGGLDGICLSAVIGNKFDGKIRYLVNDLLLYLENLKSIFGADLTFEDGSLSSALLDLLTKKYSLKNENILVESTAMHNLQTFKNKGFKTSFYLPQLVGLTDESKLVPTVDSIKQLLIQYPTTGISSNVNAYEVINKYFKNERKFLWHMYKPYSRHQIKNYRDFRKYVSDATVEAVLIKVALPVGNR
mgnify:CR=1 FL=1